MPAARVNVPLDTNELTALVQMAKTDCRHPREQMRHLLREAAQHRGLLPTENLNEAEEAEHCNART
jgi:hypothetical protein